MMDKENRLSIICSHLDKAIMEINGTYERDLLLEAQVLIKKAIWGAKLDKKYIKEGRLKK